MGWLSKNLGTIVGIGAAAFTGGASLALSAGLGLGGAALLGRDDSAEQLKRQQELMLQQQQAQLNSMRQQNLLDAANASSNIANVVTGDTLTVAETIKKRRQGSSISSSLGL